MEHDNDEQIMQNFHILCNIVVSFMNNAISSFSSYSDDNNNNHQNTYNLHCGPPINCHFEQSHFGALNTAMNYNFIEPSSSILTMQMHPNINSNTYMQHAGNHLYYNWQVSSK